MPLPDMDSSVGHSFGVEFDGIAIKEITEIAGLKFEQDVIELKQNTSDGKYVIKKLPGRWKAGEVTLTRGLTGDNSFDKWIKDAQLGKMTDARKGGAIIFYDFEGAAIKRVNLLGCWANKLEYSTLKAGDNSVLTEKLTIHYESATPA